MPELWCRPPGNNGKIEKLKDTPLWRFWPVGGKREIKVELRKKGLIKEGFIVYYG